MVSPLVSGRALVVNADSAFWGDEAPSPTLKRYAFASDAGTTFDTDVHIGPTLDANNVYWASQQGVVYSMPQSFSTSSSPQNLYVSTLPVDGLASDGTNLYVGELNPSGPARLLYLPVGVGGGNATPLFTSGGGDERNIVAVGGAVYWLDVDSNASPTTTNIMGIAAP
jgi:hypothetical protein